MKKLTRRDFPLEKIENDALFVEAMENLLYSYRATLSGPSEMGVEHTLSAMIELKEWLGDR